MIRFKAALVVWLFISLSRIRAFDLSKTFYGTLDCKGNPGCALDQPSIVVLKGNMDLSSCALQCLDLEVCVNFNYWKTTKSCQLFDYFSYKIKKMPGCSNFDNLPRKVEANQNNNLARYQRTCQSTTGAPTGKLLESWLAVDDLNGTRPMSGQCSHTNEGDTGNNWFMVDLQRFVTIRYVRILARRVDIPQLLIRYKNLTIGVTNNSWLDKTPIRNQYPLCGVYLGGKVNANWFNISCQPSVPPARYCIVHQTPVNDTRGGCLSLCEFQVYGTF